MTAIGLHHVQLAMPAGGEEEARAFYAGVLGIPEVAKPEPLAARGGAWFEQGALRVHLGVEEGFRPARKAHPALLVDDLDQTVAALEAAGYPVGPGKTLPGMRRTFVDDPFGNRVELVEEPVDPNA